MSEWINEDGSFGDITTAPEPIREFVEKKNFKSIGDMTNSYAEMESYSGKIKSTLNIPEQLTDEMTAQIRSRLGVPSDIDGYDLGDAGQTLKPEVVESLKKLGLEQGFTPDQLKSGLALINDIANSQKLDIEAQALATEEELKAELGDKFQPFIDGAVAAANKLGMLEIFNDTGLIARKDVMEKLNAVDKLISEGVIKSSEAAPAKTKASTQSELEAHPAFLDKMHPEHNKIIADWQKTFQPG